jgi:hypothetical protein
MKGTTADKVNLRKSNSISSSTRVILELNQNRYLDIDKNYIDDNKSTYYGTNISQQNYLSDRFPLDSVVKPIRPQKTGACFARFVPSISENSSKYKHHSIKNFNKTGGYCFTAVSGLSNTYEPVPRVYYPGPGIGYQNYTQFSNRVGGWNNFNVSIKYTTSFWTNKIVIGFETTQGTPGPVSISIDTGTSTESWQAISGTFTPDATTGQVVIYRTSNENAWSSSKPSYGSGGYWDCSSGYINTAVRIKGIKIDCNSTVGPVSLVEVSPKLTTDITDKLINWSWNANLSESDSLYPVGTVSSNAGTLDLDNSERLFSLSKISTSQASIAELAKPECEARAYMTVAGCGDEIPQFHTYIEKWSEDSESLISLETRDLAGLMQEVDAPDFIIKNVTPSQAIWRLLELCGVGPVRIKDYKNSSNSSSAEESEYYQEEIFPVFFTRSDGTAWDFIKTVCADTGTAVFVDEEGVVNIATRNYLFNSSRGDTTLDWQFLGQETVEDGSTSYPDIQSISYKKDEPYNSVQLKYTPIKPRSTEDDTAKDWKKNVLGYKKDTPRSLFQEAEAVVLGIGVLEKPVSAVSTINTIALANTFSTDGKKIVTTSSPHGFSAGAKWIKIYGTDNSKLDKNVKIVATTSTTFTYVDKGNSAIFNKDDFKKIATAYDAEIYVNNSAFTYGSWGQLSGYMLVDQELIKYGGAKFNSVDAVSGLKKTTIVTNELDYQVMLESSKGAVEFTGRFTGIERGKFYTTTTAHESGIDFTKWIRNSNVAPQSFTQYNYQKQETGEIDNAIKIYRSNAGAGKRTTSVYRTFSEAYSTYFAAMKVVYKSTTDSSGGIVLWPKVDANNQITDGIFFEVMSTADKKDGKDVAAENATWKAARNKQQEIRIFEMQSGQEKNTVLAYADIRNGQVENIRISKKSTSSGKTKWGFYLDDKLITSITVKNSDFSDVNKKRIALYSVGKSTVYFKHVGGVDNFNKDDEDNFFISLKSILSNVLSNRSGVTSRVPYEIDNFDNSVRAAYYNNVRFSTSENFGPAHSIENFWSHPNDQLGKLVDLDNTGKYTYDIYTPFDNEIAEAISRQTPFGAEIFAVNVSSSPKILVSKDKRYPIISGPIVEFAKVPALVEKKNESSINRLGTKLFEKKLKWISNKTEVELLARDILNLSKQGIKKVTIDSFNNHLIQLGDCVKISYADKDFNSDESYVVIQISSSWDNGLKSQIDLVTQDAR